MKSLSLTGNENYTQLFDIIREAHENICEVVLELFDITHNPERFEYPTNELEKADEFFLDNGKEVLNEAFHRFVSLTLFRLDCKRITITNPDLFGFSWAEETNDGMIFFGWGEGERDYVEDEELSVTQKMKFTEYFWELD